MWRHTLPPDICQNQKAEFVNTRPFVIQISIRFGVRLLAGHAKRKLNRSAVVIIVGFRDLVVGIDDDNRPLDPVSTVRCEGIAEVDCNQMITRPCCKDRDLNRIQYVSLAAIGILDCQNDEAPGRGGRVPEESAERSVSSIFG